MEFQYKGLTATLEHITITEEGIERQLKRLDGQDTSEFSPEELHDLVRESLESHYAQQAEEELLDRLIRQAAATLDYTPSDDEIAKGAESQLQVMQAQLAQRDLTLEAYANFMGTTQDAILEDLRADAAQMLKIQAAIDRIAALENIRAEESEIRDACKVICRQNQLSAEELEALYNEEFAEAVNRSVIGAKVLEFVKNAAIITEITT